eukprot:403373564
MNKQLGRSISTNLIQKPQTQSLRQSVEHEYHYKRFYPTILSSDPTSSSLNIIQKSQKSYTSPAHTIFSKFNHGSQTLRNLDLQQTSLLESKVQFQTEYQINHNKILNGLTQSLQKIQKSLLLPKIQKNMQQSQILDSQILQIAQQNKSTKVKGLKLDTTLLKDPVYYENQNIVNNFIGSPLWKGLNSQFSESYRIGGMFQENTMLKAEYDKQKFDVQKQRLKDLLERQKSQFKLNQDKIQLVMQFQQLPNIKNVPSQSKLLNMSLPDLNMKLNQLQINQKVITAVLKIQGGWRMFKAKKLYEIQRRLFMRRIVFIQRKIKEYIKRKQQRQYQQQCATKIQGLYRGFKIRKNLVFYMSQKVNTSLQLFNDIRERIYEGTVKKIIVDWRLKTTQSIQEKKQNAYRTFLVKSLQVYHRLKKNQSKKSVPRYMQNLKRTNVLGGGTNVLNTSNITQKSGPNGAKQISTKNVQAAQTQSNQKSKKPEPIKVQSSTKTPTLTNDQIKNQPPLTHQNNSTTLQVPQPKDNQSTHSKASAENSSPIEDTHIQDPSPNPKMIYNNINNVTNLRRLTSIEGQIVENEQLQQINKLIKQKGLVRSTTLKIKSSDINSFQNNGDMLLDQNIHESPIVQESPSIKSEFRHFNFFNAQNPAIQEDEQEELLGDVGSTKPKNTSSKGLDSNFIDTENQLIQQSNNIDEIKIQFNQNQGHEPNFISPKDNNSSKNKSKSKFYQNISPKNFQNQTKKEISPKTNSDSKKSQTIKENSPQQMPMKPSLEEMKISIENVKTFKSKKPKQTNQRYHSQKQINDSINQIESKTVNDKVDYDNQQKLVDQAQDFVNWNSLDEQNQQLFQNSSDIKIIQEANYNFITKQTSSNPSPQKLNESQNVESYNRVDQQDDEDYEQDIEQHDDQLIIKMTNDPNTQVTAAAQIDNTNVQVSQEKTKKKIKKSSIKVIKSKKTEKVSPRKLQIEEGYQDLYSKEEIFGQVQF